jgi:hypothetical protein
MSPVSAASGQRLTDQFAFDGGDRMADKPANGFDFSR